jgi:hypothetical protein
MAKDDRRGESTFKGDGPVTLVEKSGFTRARCECGWAGPGRRSRKKARADAGAHLDEGCKATLKKK